jgi:hypothetical protein
MQRPSNAGSVGAPGTPATPVSPQVLAREQERVAHLLTLNSLLLKEIISLQSQGKSGPPGQAMPQKEEDLVGKTNMPAKEFLEYVFILESFPIGL